jgi:hypothetical protein
MSKAKEENVIIVDKANSLNTDYREKTTDIQCLTCKYGCISFEFLLNGRCNNYSKRMSLRVIWDEIRGQNIHLRKLCNKNGLSYNTMMKMLNNKLALSYRYYFALEQRIMEKNEYIRLLEDFDGKR